jgi:putative aldouronate transport system permease protein
LFLLLFKYTPLYGVLIAFQDFNIFEGIKGSEWVGLEQFHKLIQSEEFGRVFMNTLLISVYKIVILFLSWVIISGLFVTILSTSGGLVNNIIQWFGGEPVSFFVSNEYFRSLVVFTAGWKETGWNAIVFIAAIAGIDQEQYEAAAIDGAGRIRRMLHISIPGILPTVVLMFILRLGSVLDAGTEQILTMYNPVVYETADVIGTFVYRIGLGKMDYSFSTAVGLFNSVVGFILIVSGNYISRKLLKRGIW